MVYFCVKKGGKYLILTKIYKKGILRNVEEFEEFVLYHLPLSG